VSFNVLAPSCRFQFFIFENPNICFNVFFFSFKNPNIFLKVFFFYFHKPKSQFQLFFVRFLAFAFAAQLSVVVNIQSVLTSGLYEQEHVTDRHLKLKRQITNQVETSETSSDIGKIF
jgi:hypothetical protein